MAERETPPGVIGEVDELMEGYRKSERKTADRLKEILQGQTREARETHLIEVNNYHGVEILGIVAKKSDGNDAGWREDCVALNTEGILVELTVLGEPEDDDWTYAGTLGEEVQPDQYIKLAPDLIKRFSLALSAAKVETPQV